MSQADALRKQILNLVEEYAQAVYCTEIRYKG